MNYVYLITNRENGLEHEVSKAEWVRHERMAGFRNTLGEPLEPATQSFASSNYSFSGRIVSEQYYCRHPLGEGCYKCCDRCNYDTHTCPGCGIDVNHGTVCCEDCEKL